MTATQVIVEVLGVSEARAIHLQQLIDTTLDGSNWNDASFWQIVQTARYAEKAVA